MPISRQGDSVPLVTTPSPCGACDRVVLARDAGAGEGERHQRLVGLDAAQRLGADEARVELAAPAEAGLDRVAVLGQVVAVEVEADLEAQRVARAEARPAARPAASSASQTAAAPSGRRASARSRPRRCSRCRTRAPRRPPPRARRCACASAARPDAIAVERRARLGPWTASIAQSACGVLTSTSKPSACSRNQARSLLVVGGVGDRQEAPAGPRR